MFRHRGRRPRPALRLCARRLDGYAVFTTLAAASDLDQCGGHNSDLLGYHYHAAQAAENLVVRCLAGEIARQ